MTRAWLPGQVAQSKAQTTHSAGEHVRDPVSLFPSDENMAAATDLYQLTMAAGYHANRVEHTAVFELFVRGLPRNRSYLVAAGLEQALYFLSHFHFSEGTIAYLRSQPAFGTVFGEFFDYLARMRFTGDVHAMPEGTVFFPDEPVLRVRAPVIQAQLVETYLLSVLNFETLVATKASRVVQAAQGRSVVDFGTRRAHGPQAGVLAARASYVGGCTGTSNVLAGRELGIPIVGTAAHSWTMAFPTEMEAFERYHEVFPEGTILLIDTYDTLDGARNAIRIGPELKGVRLDSGDLISLSIQVRHMLDEAGLKHVKIVASGDLNEYKISLLLAAGAPIDVFGVGTEMVTSRDDPAIGGVYKLVEMIDGEKRIPKVKWSNEKETYPYGKQVFRRTDARGQFEYDVVGRDDEKIEGTPLLHPVMREGEICADAPGIAAIRERTLDQVSRLPDVILKLDARPGYRVEWSRALHNAREALRPASRGEGSK